MWPQFCIFFIGLWLLAVPPMGASTPELASNDAVLGLTVAATALISLWEATRALRWLNFVIGLWLLLAPLVLGCEQVGPILNDFVSGLLLMVLASRKGKIIHRYGGGWAALCK